MNKIKYDYDEETRSIVLPEGAPFDGKDYLIKFAEGWVEARWIDIIPTESYHDGIDYEGWQWCCLDDKFQKELDDALFWLPMPEKIIEALEGITNHYTDMIKSGDCGNWNPENDKPVQEVRTVLSND